MKRPNREKYPNGIYGNIDYDSRMEKYCTYLENKLEKAITVTCCCKSDSEQLVLFADWLQYNGKWSTTEKQAKDFLKEQQKQN